MNNVNCSNCDAPEWRKKMKFLTKNSLVYKMLNLIYIIALVTLLMDSLACTLTPIEAAQQYENITRLTKVAPPETSSLSDRLSTIFATSPTSPGSPRALLTSSRNANCTFLHDTNKLKSSLNDQSAISDYSEYSSGSLEDHRSLEENTRGRIPVLGDPEESYRPISTCQTCNRSHDDIIAANLKSIQDLLLLKLGFSKPPNMTNKHAIPHVPQKIVDDFLKKHHLHKQGKGRLGGSDEGMMGDDPNVMNKFYDNYPREVYEEEDDDYFPITERVYVFPKTPIKLRHGAKQRNGHTDVLQFHFNTVKHSQVTKAILHIFVHSEQWLAEHDSAKKHEKTFNVTVHKVKRTSKAYQQLVSFHEGHVPKTKGHYLSIDVTSMVDEWYRNPSSNYGTIIKVNGQNGHKLIVLNSGDRDHSPYIEMLLEDTRKRRTKRSLSLTCNKEDNEKRCCRYPLMVDFRKFAWDWIIAPNDYMANYCAGECTITFLSKYMHTHVWQLSTSATPCCSPTKMAPLILLYYDTNYNVVQSTIPNMVVEKCSCS